MMGKDLREHYDVTSAETMKIFLLKCSYDHEKQKFPIHLTWESRGQILEWALRGS